MAFEKRPEGSGKRESCDRLEEHSRRGNSKCKASEAEAESGFQGTEGTGRACRRVSRGKTLEVNNRQADHGSHWEGSGFSPESG